MKSQKDIQNRIDEAMDSITGIEPVPSNPFLYEKIRNRMANKEANAKAPVAPIPAFRLAALCLLLILNVWFIGTSAFSTGGNAELITDTNVEYIMESYEIGSAGSSIYN